MSIVSYGLGDGGGYVSYGLGGEVREAVVLPFASPRGRSGGGGGGRKLLVVDEDEWEEEEQVPLRAIMSLVPDLAEAEAPRVQHRRKRRQRTAGVIQVSLPEMEGTEGVVFQAEDAFKERKEAAAQSRLKAIHDSARRLRETSVESWSSMLVGASSMTKTIGTETAIVESNKGPSSLWKGIAIGVVVVGLVLFVILNKHRQRR